MKGDFLRHHCWVQASFCGSVLEKTDMLHVAIGARLIWFSVRRSPAEKDVMLHLLSCPGTLQVRPCWSVLPAISAASVEGKSIGVNIRYMCMYIYIYTCISCTCLCLGAGMVQKDMLIASSLIYLGWIRDSMVLWLWLGPRASPKFKDISFHPMKSHWVFDKEATLELASNNTHHA